MSSNVPQALGASLLGSKQMHVGQVVQTRHMSWRCIPLFVLQPATAGMLPPSSSEDESETEEEKAAAKARATKPPRPAVMDEPKK